MFQDIIQKVKRKVWIYFTSCQIWNQVGVWIYENEDQLTDTDKKYLTDITEKFVEDNISADDAKKKNALEFIQQLLIKME